MSTVRQNILNSIKPRVLPISLPEWGEDGTFFVREMTGVDHQEWSDIGKEYTGIEKQVYLSLVDADERRIFNREDLGQLRALPATNLIKVVNFYETHFNSDVETAKKN